jgi:hypothetical protein
VSKLLEHLCNKSPLEEDTGDASTLDALGGTAADAARVAARSAAAEAEAAKNEAEFGAPRHGGGGQELGLAGRGLAALPHDVWLAGAAAAA